MAIPMLRLQGTRAEIVESLPDFGGRQLRVEVYSDEQETKSFLDESSKNVPLDYQVTLATALQQVAANARAMTPGQDNEDYLRAGRAGEMFGYDE